MLSSNRKQGYDRWDIFGDFHHYNYKYNRSALETANHIYADKLKLSGLRFHKLEKAAAISVATAPL